MTPARSKPLDGLRGCAVVAVMAYHAHYPWARGGFLGVDIFFVLSGFLITGGLLRVQLARGPRPVRDYARFLARRAARLVPALLTALGCAWLLTAFVGSAADRARLPACTITAAGYAMNLPGGERLGCSAIWHVTWSLASEEQFYVLWPLLLAAVIAAARIVRVPVPAAVVAAAVSLYLASVVWQLSIRAGGASTARVLFAPDGRSLVLLIGCALAAATYNRPARMSRRLPAVLGAAALVADLGFASAGAGYGTLVALLVAAAATAAVIAGVTSTDRDPVSRLLASPLPVALGRLSYSLYLLHEIAFRAADHMAERGTLAYELIRWPLCAAAAICSYRWIEQPCRLRLNTWLDRDRSPGRAGQRLRTSRQPLAVGTLAAK
jgi:peptidoglycan/LPS O-acetylase OafA/YrhL